MGIGVSVFLIAVGAVLAFAVTADASGVDLDAVGVILMAVGAVGLALTLVVWGDRPVVRRREPVHHHDHYDDEHVL